MSSSLGPAFSEISVLPWAQRNGASTPGMEISETINKSFLLGFFFPQEFITATKTLDENYIVNIKYQIEIFKF